MPPSEFDQELQRLEVDLKRLEADYTKFFAGRLPLPPLAHRSRVQALVTQYDRRHIQNTSERFRFTTIQARFAALTNLWDRALRAREDGRASPLSPQRPPPAAGTIKRDE